MRFVKIILRSALVLTMVLALYACVEEGENAIDGKGPNLIKLTATDGEAIALFDAVPSKVSLIEVRRFPNSNAELNSTVTLNYAFDDAIVAETNAGLDPVHDQLFTVLKAPYLSLTGNTVTFAPGELVKQIEVDFNPSGLNFSKRYGVGIALTSPTGDFKLAEGKGSALVSIIVKNQYDGVYAYTGNVYRYSADGAALNDGLDGPVVAGVTRDLITNGANSVLLSPVWASGGTGIGGIGSPVIVTIDPNTNNITLTPSIPPVAANWGAIPGERNYYDPATKKMYLNWKWGGASASPTNTTRAFRLVLTYQKPR